MPAARPKVPAPELSWWGWGDPTRMPELSAEVTQLLVEGLGIKAPGRRLPAIADLSLPAIRLEDAVVDQLRAVVGEPNTSTDPEARTRHARGRSTPDLFTLRAGHLSTAPDLVLWPANHDEVLALLAICSERRVAVTPFGGGTSVVGGVDPSTESFAGHVTLDLRRMNALLELDEQSRLAVLEPGLRGPQAEALLSERGYTIGHFPQSFQYATLGGFAAARSSGQASAGYGRFDELVLGLRVATPQGTLMLGRAPKSAAGPDLRQLILGSEGALGVITSLSVQVRPAPERRVYEGWRFSSFSEGTAMLRRLVQNGPLPTVLRLSDEAETALNLARPAEVGQPGTAAAGALAIVGYEGTPPETAERQAKATAILREAGATLEPDAGDAWAEDRYRGPYLRDALLDAGALVETLETVTFWSNLGTLYQAVGDALRDSLSAQGTPPVVLCHISHVYPAGASLYFTVGCAAREDPLSQWRAAKAAASDAIIAVGGSITHHHGIGRDHREWYLQEIGTLGVQILSAIKAQLDPAGILNPGVLLPDGQR